MGRPRSAARTAVSGPAALAAPVEEAGARATAARAPVPPRRIGPALPAGPAAPSFPLHAHGSPLAPAAAGVGGVRGLTTPPPTPERPPVPRRRPVVPMADWSGRRPVRRRARWRYCSVLVIVPGVVGRGADGRPVRRFGSAFGRFPRPSITLHRCFAGVDATSARPLAGRTPCRIGTGGDRAHHAADAAPRRSGETSWPATRASTGVRSPRSLPRAAARDPRRTRVLPRRRPPNVDAPARTG